MEAEGLLIPSHLSTQGAISPEPECPGLQRWWHPWSRGGLGGLWLQSIARSQGQDWGWGWGVPSAGFLKAEITGLEHSLPWLLPPSEHEEWNCSLNNKQGWSSKTGQKRKSVQSCTMLLRALHRSRWNYPENMSPDLFSLSDPLRRGNHHMVGLGCPGGCQNNGFWIGSTLVYQFNWVVRA